MKKIKEARDILDTLGLPPAQQNEMSALTLIALCGLSKNDSWQNSQKHSLTISKGIMDFITEKYKRKYAPNTRETFRRQVLHQFVQARLVDYNPDNPQLPTNSPLAHYSLTDEALSTIQIYGTDKWTDAVKIFISTHSTLMKKYMKQRELNSVPVVISTGLTLRLSPGKHNAVQAAIVQEFAPRFAPGTTLLYLGDTVNKNLFVDTEKLNALGISMTNHDKLPDVILFDEERNWLFLIEAVTAHGPMTPKRIVEFDEMFSKCSAGPVYVTAFPDFSEFKKHTSEIAWETEVWIVENPDHMIHYNGDHFMGPRK